MSISVEGQKCPACNAYLFDDDDIVFCPECGAPHHRDCYATIGHCALMEDHGTDRQYDIASRIKEEAGKSELEDKTESSEESQEKDSEQARAYRCVRCGTELGSEQQVCPRCRTPRVDAESIAYTPFGPRVYRKWSEQTVIEGDVTLKEIVPVVGVNSARYSEKFVTLNKKNKVSWNWMAFLFPAGWAMSRKCFKYGIMFLTAFVVGALLSLPMSEIISSLPLEGATPADLAPLIANGGALPAFLYLIGGALELGVRIIAGLFGDYIYRGECVEKALKIRESTEEKETLYYKLGGVNALWFVVALAIQSYVPMIISAFF